MIIMRITQELVDYIAGLARLELEPKEKRDMTAELERIVAYMDVLNQLDTAGAVLFLEDIGERPYRLDGMLTHLRNSGALERCAAILLGAFTDCVAEDPARSLTIPEVIRDVVEPVCREKNIPLVTGLTCGHTLPTMSLPLGATVQLKAGADGSFLFRPAAAGDNT